jgi:hypothetical protein
MVFFTILNVDYKIIIKLIIVQKTFLFSIN